MNGKVLLFGLTFCLASCAKAAVNYPVFDSGLVVDGYVYSTDSTTDSAPISINTCGNGKIDSDRFEECDGVNLNTQTCQSLGFDSGQLSCSAICKLDTSNCSYFSCGDGKIVGNEQCEKGLLNGKTCVTQGFTGGDIDCNSNCTLNTSGCYKCGDGVVNGADQCDGSAYGGKTCITQGFVGGTLDCNSNCTFNTAKCHNCGNSILNSPEECDGTSFGSQTCLTKGFTGGSLVCGGDCKISTTNCTNNRTFLVNQTVANNQSMARVAASTGSRFAIVWESAGQDGSGQGVYQRGLEANGTFLGNELLVNQATAEDQIAPVVTGLSDAGWIVAFGSGGSFKSLQAQRYSSTGAAVGANFAINSWASTSNPGPSLSSVAAGGFVVSYNLSYGDDSPNWNQGVFCKKYSAAMISSSEMHANTYTPSDQYQSVVKVLANNNFVVAWTSPDQDASGTGVYAQLFTSAGAKSGSEFRVNQQTSGNQSGASIVALSDGGFIIIYQGANAAASSQEIWGHLYNSAGASASGDIQLNSNINGDQIAPRAAMLQSGQIIAVWSSSATDGNGTGIYARNILLSSTSISPLASDAIINTYTTGNQTNPDVAVAPEGRYLIVWEGQGAEDSYGIYARILP